jgi:hypothetical protein
MKMAAIILDRELRREDILFDPFEHKSWEGRCAQMQHYHDEYQFQVCPTLVEYVAVDKPSYPEGAAKEEKAEMDKRVKQKLNGLMPDATSDISHVADEWWIGKSVVGELMSDCIRKGAEHYNLRVPFAGEYQIGTNWAECH